MKLKEMLKKNGWFAALVLLLLISVLLLLYRKDLVNYFNRFGSAASKGFEHEESTELEIIDESLIPIVPTFQNIRSFSFEELTDYVYAVDPTAYLLPKDIPVDSLLNTKLNANLQGTMPKLLIFHTHSQETFRDSRPGSVEDSIVGVGNVLADILVTKYNVSVVHDYGIYDMENNEENRIGSYERMAPAIQKIIKKYPTIEVAIDLHRDGVEEDVRLVTEMNGEKVAMLMFFNGICRENKNGLPVDVHELYNPYLKENLAFSLQMQLTANELYKGLTRRIYIKPYRYSLHMLPKSLLVEVGANTNTVAEAKAAMKPLAEILMKVLQK